MAVVHRIKGSDGQIHRVRADENADPSELVFLVEQQIIQNRQLPEPAPVAPTPEKAGALRRLGDLGISAVQGAIGLPESIVGLADIPTGGRVGKALEGIGYKPAEAKQILQGFKSPEQQAAEQAVQEAEGFIPTAKAAIQNPSALASTIIQSAPSMLGGAGIARGAIGAIPKLSPVIAAGIGEGAISAGATAENARQQSASGLLTPEQSGIATVSGALTGALGVLGGKVAEKYLKVGDIDTILAGGVNPAEKGRLLTSVIKAGLAESTLEELPQSMQEQIASNLSAGKPWDEGVAEAGAMGVMAALPLGGAAGYMTHRAAEKEDKRLSGIIAPEQARIAALKREAGTSGQYTDQLQAAAAEREMDIAGKAGVDEQLGKEAKQPPKYQEEIELYPETSVEEIAARRAAESTQGDLFIPESKIQEIQKPKLDEDTITSFGFKKNSLAYKALEALSKSEESPEVLVKRFDQIIDNNQDKIKTTAQGDAVDKFRALLNKQIKIDPELLAQQQQEELSLRAEQERIKQEKIIQANIKAREQELAIFDNDPMKKAAFEQGPAAWDAYQAQEKVQIPDEAYPVYEEAPEVSYEQKMAELERARNEYEAEMFALEEQYPNPVTPTIEEEAVNEPIPAGQEALFTKTGRPTAAALRGVDNRTRISEAQPQGTIPSAVQPVQPAASAVSEAETPNVPTLGDVGRSTGRPTGRVETREETGATTLGAEDQAIKRQLSELLMDGMITRKEYSGYTQMLAQNGPQATDAIAKTALAEAGYLSPYENPSLINKTVSEKPAADVVQDYKEAVELEAEAPDELTTESYDSRDQYMESKKAKPKAKGEPKKVPAELRKPTTERVTPAELQSVIEKWFNPVWYKQAVKAGWLNIIDGDINDTTLPDATKENYNNAKALFTPEGKVYFFTKNITKGNELGVVLHEIGEHKGLENLIGKARVTQLANRVRQMAEGKGSAREIAMAKEAMEMAQGEKANDKELIAYFGEIAVFNGVRPGAKGKPEFGKALAWLNELWGSVRKALEKLHFNPDKITDKDIVDMLYGAARLEMGAAQITQQQIGEPVPNEPEILASYARNPAWELPADVAADRKARGLPVFNPPQNETMKEKMLNNMGVTSTWTEWFDRAGNAIVGPLYSLHRKATNYYGPESFYTKSTGKLLGSLMAQHALNANNLTFEAIKQGGLKIDARGFIESTQSKDNIIALNDDYNAIMAAMQRDDMSAAEAYQNTAMMILADRYKSLIKMGIKSKEEFSSEAMTESARLKQQYAKEYTQWRDRYNAMRKNKEDFLVDSGLYTREEAGKLLNRLEYVPLYRIKDSEGADGVFMQGLLSAKQLQKLQFDTKNYDVADVMTNIALNEMWLYKKAIFNHTTNLLVDQVAEMGIGRPMKMKPQNDEQTVAYLRDGKIEYFRFDDPNDMAMLKAVPVINNWAVKQMRLMGSILRKGITLTPSFIYRQVWQDVERAWMQSGTNQPFMKMLGQSIREQAANAKKNAETETARALRSRGVIGAVEYQDSFENAIDELFGRDKADQSMLEKVYKKLEYMERLAQNSDMAARAVVYENTLKEVNPTTGEKYTPGEAALRAQMMLNYQHRGTSPLLRTLLATIPFVNTKLQSEWRLVDALQGKVPGLSKEKAKTILAGKVLKMALLTAAYAMTRTGDDDYEEASDENRNRNFLINVGGIPLRIPVAPEYLVIKTGMEQLTRKAIDAEFYSDRKLGHAVASSLGGLLLGASDVTPAIIRPLLENMTNYSFFNDRALVGQGLQNLDVNLQKVEGQTSELAKFISNQLQAVGGNTVNVSPIKIDNLINGIFGTMGRDVIFLTNQLADAIQGTERPDLKPNQYFEVGTAFYDTKGGQRKADYYELRDKVSTAYSSYLRLQKTDPEAARAYMQENRQLIAMRSPIEAIGNRLEQLRAQRNRIIADKQMSGEEKRAKLDRITEMENQIVTEPTKRIRERLQ